MCNDPHDDQTDQMRKEFYQKTGKTEKQEAEAGAKTLGYIVAGFLLVVSLHLIVYFW